MDENNQKSRKTAASSSVRRSTQSGNSQKTRVPQSGNRSTQSRNTQGNHAVQGTGEQAQRSTQKKKISAARRKQIARMKKRRQQMRLVMGAVIVLLIALIGIIIAVSSNGPSSDSETSSIPEIITEERTEEQESESETESTSEIQPSEIQGADHTGGQTVYATVRVNVRSLPDTTTSEILGKLEAGASIVRSADENGWSTVDYNGTIAYISSEFLTVTQPQADGPAADGSGTVVSHSRTWPKLADGTWDLNNITNDDSSVAYGNAIVGFGYSESARDPVTKIPGDWTYYEKNWGMFNVDWIQDPALPQNQNTIYLTMDEGFPNENTQEILRILKEKNVKATFFITKTFFDGSAEQVRQMLAEGHTVGNHSCTHPTMPKLSIEEQTSQIMTLHNLVKDQLGYEMKLFRFPEGSFTSRSLALVDNLGYKTAFWSYTYKDYDQNAQKDPAETLQMVLDNLHNGAIYLLHADSATNLSILPQFIDGVRERGFEFGVYPLTAN